MRDLQLREAGLRTEQNLRLMSELGHFESGCISVRRRGSHHNHTVVFKCLVSCLAQGHVFSQQMTLWPSFFRGKRFLLSFPFYALLSLHPLPSRLLHLSTLSLPLLSPVISTSLISLCSTIFCCIELFSPSLLILSFSIFKILFPTLIQSLADGV